MIPDSWSSLMIERAGAGIRRDQLAPSGREWIRARPVHSISSFREPDAGPRQNVRLCAAPPQSSADSDHMTHISSNTKSEERLKLHSYDTVWQDRAD